MRPHSSRIGIAATLFLFTTITFAFSAYKEGLDTTSSDGYCRDSLFGISGNSIVLETGSKLIAYEWSCGYFNSAFDDIVKAPDTLSQVSHRPASLMNTCYVIYRNRDHTYSKICILRKLSNGSYIFRYGRNTVPNNLLLIADNYDKSIRYKPNNLHFSSHYEMPRTFSHLFWEPPLSGINTLIGFTIYFSKRNVTLDTTKPVDPSQWDSVGFTKFNEFSIEFNSQYLNMAAIYEKGKSDLFKGWMRQPMLIGIRAPVTNKVDRQPRITIVKKTSTEYCFEINDFSANVSPQSVALYSNSGRRVAGLSELIGDGYFWYMSGSNHPQGSYVVKALFSDNSAISRQVILMR
jgi:hypothetical protein